MSRFDYVQYDDKAQALQSVFKAKMSDLEALVDMISRTSEHPKASGRASALAITKLEEAYMWIGKAIRDDLIARTGSAPLQEERKNG